MANSRKGQKVKPWTAQEESRLLLNVEKHVMCLARAFEATSKEIRRSPKAISAHWYQRTSKNCGRTLFMTVSGKHVAVNRKNSKGQPLKLPMYKKILSFLGLRY